MIKDFRCLKVSDRSLKILLAEQDNAPVQLGFPELRVDLESSLIGLNRFTGFSETGKSKGYAEMSAIVIWLVFE